MPRDLIAGPLMSQYIYVDGETGYRADSIASLLSRRKPARFSVDEDFCDLYLAGSPTWPRTIVQGVSKFPLPRSERPHKKGPEVQDFSSGQLNCYLEDYFRSFDFSQGVAIALSGGVDSQLLAKFFLRRGIHVRAYSLRSRIESYCEWAAVEHFSGAHNLEVLPIDVSAADFVSSVQEFVAAMETPIYNLHAVSKWLLARQLHQLGEARVVSGDGADQIFMKKSECDLFPLTVRSFAVHQIDLLTPFATPGLIKILAGVESCGEKKALKRLAAEWGVALLPKVASFFPGDDSHRSAQVCLRSSLKCLKSEFEFKGIVECAGLRESSEAVV